MSSMPKAFALVFHLLAVCWSLLVPEPINKTESQEVWSERSQPPKRIDGWADEDSDLWLRGKPNIKRRHLVKNGGHVVFDVSYRTDDEGRRIVPLPDVDARPDTLLFFGCSFVFGQGVSDDQTLPYYAGKLAASYRPYNYGFPGYGTSQIVAKIQRGDLARELKRKTGKVVAVYAFPDFHIRRNIGAMELVIHKATGFPYYYLDTHGDLRRDGDFVTGRRWLTSFYQITGISPFIQAFNVNLPPRLSDYDYRLTAKMIEALKFNFKSQFETDDFYVVIYPGSLEQNVSAMKAYFQRYAIRYLDYSNLVPLNDERYWIKGDGHPTPLTNQLVARRLVKDLKL